MYSFCYDNANCYLASLFFLNMECVLLSLFECVSVFACCFFVLDTLL